MKKLLSIPAYYYLLIGFIPVLMWSCQKSDGHPKKTVPLKAEFQVATTIISPGSPGVLEHASASGSGAGTPFGKATVGDDIHVNVSVSPEIIDGVDTITTYTGDKIFSTFSGTSPGPDKDLNFQVFNKAIIRGGTGVYAGATGSFTVNVSGNFKNLTADALYAGAITY